MDAFSGYNQIRMHPDDREKTSFITDRGTYCYKVMPFGLKNAGSTYQCLVNKMFADQLGKTMEVYIDNMLVKSARADDHIDHLKTCFEILNKYDMKLNSEKCTSGVTLGGVDLTVLLEWCARVVGSSCSELCSMKHARVYGSSSLI
ncbi:RNA-directed DNA polymerase-like protein [Cardamine amara subsp. amara]|uniref:RNA-directed DNA polymerase-like protein n=1 Tax=Cardamine amara subsp. amara TaxID=228776 RepID=A0ABD1AVC5_CARAN